MAKRRIKSGVTYSGKSKYVMTQSHKNNISKALRQHHKNRGYKIVRRVSKKDKASVNDNNPGKVHKPKGVIIKQGDKFVKAIRKGYKGNRRLALAELKDYKKVRNAVRARKAKQSDLFAYAKRSRRRAKINKVVNGLKSIFGR